jgi:hypothetical protein
MLKAFSMHFLFLFLPSACTSFLYSFLQHVLLVFNPSILLCIPLVCIMLKEGIKARSACCEGRNTNKKHTQKDGLKTRRTS